MQDSTFLAFIIYVLSRIVKHSNLTVFLEQAFEPFPEENDPGPGQKVVDQQRCDDANGGVEDAVESVAHIGLNGGAEQNDAEHHDGQRWLF